MNMNVLNTFIICFAMLAGTCIANDEEHHETVSSEINESNENTCVLYNHHPQPLDNVTLRITKPSGFTLEVPSHSMKLTLPKDYIVSETNNHSEPFNIKIEFLVTKASDCSCPEQKVIEVEKAECVGKMTATGIVLIAAVICIMILLITWRITSLWTKGDTQKKMMRQEARLFISSENGDSSRENSFKVSDI